eukprot:scaffold5.g973.t1
MDAPQEVDDMERLANRQAHDEVEQEHRAEEAATRNKASEKHDIEDDENETCGFCKFMKGGACRHAFIDWSKCVDSEREAGHEDFAEHCADVTLALRECMLSNRDYYGPLLEEEEEMFREDEERRQQEAEEATAAAGDGSAAAPPAGEAAEGGKS